MGGGNEINQFCCSFVVLLALEIEGKNLLIGRDH